MVVQTNASPGFGHRPAFPVSQWRSGRSIYPLQWRGRAGLSPDFRSPVCSIADTDRLGRRNDLFTRSNLFSVPALRQGLNQTRFQLSSAQLVVVAVSPRSFLIERRDLHRKEPWVIGRNVGGLCGLSHPVY